MIISRVSKTDRDASGRCPEVVFPNSGREMMGVCEPYDTHHSGVLAIAAAAAQLLVLPLASCTITGLASHEMFSQQPLSLSGLELVGFGQFSVSPDKTRTWVTGKLCLIHTGDIHIEN